MADQQLTLDQFTQEVLAYPTYLRTGDFSDALLKCAPIITEAFGDNFAKQETAGGEAWPERKDPIPKHPLLILTSKLIQAAVGGGPGHVERVWSHEINVGVDCGTVPYAAVHEYGWPERNIPSREYLGVDDNHLEQCRETIEEGVYVAMFDI